jgi:hypothetical protein
MNTRCKPGDIAYITDASPENSAAIGRLVNVVGVCPFNGFPDWQVEFIGVDPFPSFKTKSIDDAYLCPIGGVPVDEEILDEVPA